MNGRYCSQRRCGCNGALVQLLPELELGRGDERLDLYAVADDGLAADEAMMVRLVEIGVDARIHAAREALSVAREIVLLLEIDAKLAITRSISEM